MIKRIDSFSNLPAVVTGASSGIGRSLALKLARAGARVALVARREEQLTQVSDEIAGFGGESLVVPCDITDRSQVSEAAELVSGRMGDIDLLVNNAGIASRTRFLDLELDDLERTLQVNLLGAAYWTKALLPSMVSRQRGWIAFIASVAGRVHTPCESAYVASKAGMLGFAESLSLEIEDEGVHVLTVCPGIVRTPFFGPEGPPRPTTRWSVHAEPDDLADAVLKALSKGQRDLTFPPSIAASYIAQAIAPGWTRKQVKRASIDARSRA